MLYFERYRRILTSHDIDLIDGFAFFFGGLENPIFLSSTISSSSISALVLFPARTFRLVVLLRGGGEGTGGGEGRRGEGTGGVEGEGDKEGLLVLGEGEGLLVKQ